MGHKIGNSRTVSKNEGYTYRRDQYSPYPIQVVRVPMFLSKTDISVL